MDRYADAQYRLSGHTIMLLRLCAYVLCCVIDFVDLDMYNRYLVCFFFFSSRRRHTRLQGDWSSDVCSSDLPLPKLRRILRATTACAMAFALKKRMNCASCTGGRATKVSARRSSAASCSAHTDRKSVV